MRQAPDATSPVVRELPAGTELVITADLNAAGSGGPIFGPVAAGGMTWFPVYPVDEVVDVGWVGAPSEAAFKVAEPTCPASSSPSLPELAALTPGERLVCFGGTSITLSGPVAVSGIGGAVGGTWEPAWLASPIRTHIGDADQIRISVSPDVTLPEGPDTLAQLEISGHFDDPAAADCQVTAAGAVAPEDAEAVSLYCRTVFVLTSFKELS